jgi:hypothetical protein
MQGGSLSPSYTRILALHLYSLFFPRSSVAERYNSFIQAVSV